MSYNYAFTNDKIKQRPTAHAPRFHYITYKAKKCIRTKHTVTEVSVYWQKQATMTFTLGGGGVDDKKKLILKLMIL
jgi:hypothetical protein